MGSLTGGALFHTYNEIGGSGGLYGAGAAIDTERYLFSVTANGLLGASSALVSKPQTVTISAAGVNLASTGTNVKTTTEAGSGGLYGAGTAIDTERFASPISTLGGLYGAGTATNTEIFASPVVTSGAVVSGVYAERVVADTTRYAPRPAILFAVELYDISEIISFPQPDSLANILKTKQAIKLNVSGVADGVSHGDEFTLYGAKGIQVENSYNDFLTVESTT